MRKFNNFTVLLVAVFLVAALFVPAGAAVSTPEISAESTLLVEKSTSKILYEKNRSVKIAPSSITKIMTLLVAIEAVENGLMGLEDHITASETFMNGISANEITQSILPGETFILQDLLYSAYIASASDACNIIAEELSGSVVAFTDLMNEKAAELGCDDTHFSNASGSIDPDQYTTAWDIYLVMSEATEHKLFLQISAREKYRIGPTNLSGLRSLTNSNLMLRNTSGYFYEYCIAGKTDAMSSSGYSYVSYAVKNDISLISVVLGSKSIEKKDGTVIVQSYTETKRLFEWGFSEFAWKTIADVNAVVATEQVLMGEDTDVIDIRPVDTIKIFTQNDLTAANMTRDIVLFGQVEGNPLSAPVQEGDHLGDMTIYLDGKICGKVALVAAHSVALDRAEYIKMQIKETLSSIWVQLGIALLLIMTAGYVYLVVQDFRKRRYRRLKINEVKQHIIEERHRITK